MIRPNRRDTVAAATNTSIAVRREPQAGCVRSVLLSLSFQANNQIPKNRRMKQSLRLTSLLMFGLIANADDFLPETVLAKRGKLLVSENFDNPLAPLVGKPVGFASGFNGWRYTSESAAGRSGHWDLRDGAFRGFENPEAHHPATASYGLQFKDAVIQCEMRLEAATAPGLPKSYLQIKVTDTKDYVCVLTYSEDGLAGRPFDGERVDPNTKQRPEGRAVRLRHPVKTGEWHTVLLEIRGEEIAGSLEGKSITLKDPLIGSEKHSIMFVARSEGSLRALRVWEALPK